MKGRWIAACLFVLVAAAAFAGTCVVRNTSLTTIGSNKVAAGELRNDSGADFLQHQIAVAFFDEDNNLVELRTVDGCLRSLQDGTSDFFSASTDQPAVSMLSRIAFNGQLETGAVTDGDFTISGISALRTAGSLTVEGTVQNNSDRTVTDPRACTVVYDNQGRVVTTASDKDIDDLSQNETDSFTVTLPVPDSATLVDHVDIWMDALDGGTPIEPQSATGNAVIACPVTPTPSSTAPATDTPSGTPTDTATPTETTTPDTATATPTSTPAGC